MGRTKEIVEVAARKKNDLFFVKKKLLVTVNVTVKK